MPRYSGTIWEHYLLISESDGKKQVACNYCNLQYKCAQATRLKEHISKCNNCPVEVKKAFAPEETTNSVNVALFPVSSPTTGLFPITKRDSSSPSSLNEPRHAPENASMSSDDACLRKKWRNIRDSFVKTHKVMQKEIKNGAKKPSYMYYDQLLFLLESMRDTSRMEDVEDFQNENSSNTPWASKMEQSKSSFLTNGAEKETHESDDSSSASWSPPSPKRKKKSKTEDPLERELIRLLSRKLEKKVEEDEDRLFFLSLIKEFKKIPERSRMGTKVNILKVISDAQLSESNT